MLRRSFSSVKNLKNDFSHIIIGGGVVGLAIGARLAKNSDNSVLLLEQHSALGTETSSRNSEVIHAGIYFPVDALRTKLCIKGKNMIYEHAKKYNIDVQNCGKWIVAQSGKQKEYLEKLYERSKQTGVPLEWLSPQKAKQLEPSVKVGEVALESPSTGILSADSLMNFLEAQLIDNGGDIAIKCKVVGLEKLPFGGGYEVICDDGDKEPTRLTCDVVINSAGNHAPSISNMLLPADRHVTAYYAKGNYYAYSASQPKVKRLIYPCPSDFGSLGTHLTIDLGGKMKFGPDMEWVESPNDLKVSSKNLEAAKQTIASYMEIDNDALVPDYAGIRPKIVNTGAKFQDFVIRQEEGFPGFVNLLNIESPGLTSSMAIAEYVESLI